MPDDEVGVTFVMRSCNYLQALEGDIDTSHFGFLHAGHVDPDGVPEIIRSITPSPSAHPRTMSATRPGVPLMRPTAMPAQARPTGVSPTSSCRSGHSSRRASSA